MPDVAVAKTVPRKQRRFPVVWIVPIAAALLGAWVAVTRIMSEGPTITIRLDTAEGLEAGKTKIHYNGVEVGALKTIRLSDDHRSVIATAQMAPKTYAVWRGNTKKSRPRATKMTAKGRNTERRAVLARVRTASTARRRFSRLERR